MGNWKQWLVVLVLSMLWAGWMSVAEYRRRAAAHLNPVRLPGGMLAWVPSGLFWALLLEFRWQALRVPLLFFTVALFVVDIVVARLQGPERMRPFIEPMYGKGTWKSAAPFFLLMAGFASILLPASVPPELRELLFVVGAVLAMLVYFYSRRGAVKS